MTITINLYGGPLKSVLIERAFGMCGQSVTQFELSPEEYDLGLVCMNQIAPEFGPTFGYYQPPYGNGSSDDESGIDAEDAYGFTVRLAQEVSQNIGKAFRPTGPQAKACSALIAKYQSTPSRALGRQTIRGAGSRWNNWYGPFFTQATPDGETPQ